MSIHTNKIIQLRETFINDSYAMLFDMNTMIVRRSLSLFLREIFIDKPQPHEWFACICKQRKDNSACLIIAWILNCFLGHPLPIFILILYCYYWIAKLWNGESVFVISLTISFLVYYIVQYLVRIFWKPQWNSMNIFHGNITGQHFFFSNEFNISGSWIIWIKKS